MRIFPTWILLLFQVIPYFERYFCETFLEPKVLSEVEESFLLHEVEYIFTDRRITWEESEIACSAAEGGSLAIIETHQKANFLALALAETDLILEDLWVGAVIKDCSNVCSKDEPYNDSLHVRCIDSRCFQWLTGEPVDEHLMLPRFNDDTIAVRECLSFARNDHQQPSFVDLYCRLKRPYMCQRPAREEDGQMTHRGWIRIGDYEYAIFYAKKTWKESVSECFLKHKANLADFRTMKEIVGIGKYLLIGRPNLENAWIGGHYKSGEWRYISIDGVIPIRKNPDTLYPPWPDPGNTFRDGKCLLLDRHIDDGKKFTFRKERCKRKKSYICSRKIVDRNPFEFIEIDDVCYTLFYTPKTWADASETCISRNAWLVEVTEEKLDNVLYIMNENRKEINHIWIGGKLLSDNKWYWANSNDIIPSENNKIFNGYPPWLDYLFDQKYGCLNMDRENHNRAIFYGVYCKEKQPFICQQYGDCGITLTSPTTPNTETVPPDRDPWKWKWPTHKLEYTRLKPYFNQTPPFILVEN